MLLLDTPYCKVFYHQDINAVHLDWGKVANQHQFINACEIALDALVRNHSNKVIADNSKSAVVALENQQWLTDDWFPRALQKGFKYSAVVLSNDVLVKYVVKKIESTVSNALFVVEYFDSVDCAKEWLKTVS